MRFGLSLRSLRLLPIGRRLVRDGRADSPADALDKAASEWHVPDDLLFARLALLKGRAQMMAHKQGGEDWLVAVAASNELLIELVEEDVLGARSRDEGQDADEAIAILSRDTQGLPDDAAFAAKVATAVAHIRGTA